MAASEAPGLSVKLQGVTARHPAATDGAAAAIERLTLSIAPGEQVAVIGPSGAGKTTFLNLIGAALRPTAGQVLLDDQQIWGLSGAELRRTRASLFYAPQTPPLPPRQRVVTALLAARLPTQSLLQSLSQLIYPRHIDQALDALSQFDLADKLWERVDRLSGGERQRVGLARALLSPAKLWLIDEPLSALDPTRAQQAIATLTRVARDRGVTLIVSLHQVDVATKSFPRVIGLRAGHCEFDLPGVQVTAERLGRLYAHKEHELNSVPEILDSAPSPTAPKIVHCR
jgi:phosphonate transport system ATP-binding protein